MKKSDGLTLLNSTEKRAAVPDGVESILRDRGRCLTAKEVVAIVLEGRHSTKWVIQQMGPTIGCKPGRDWFFWEREARGWWVEHLERGRRNR